MYKPDFKLVPKNPGVYIFKNIDKEIIYIGKAKNLKNRIISYFRQIYDASPKTKVLVKNIANLEFIVVDNEVESLLLENRLIKQHKPKYNINLKDSKTYAYIKLTQDKFPRILSTRIVTKKGIYFGPYTDGFARRELVNLTVKLFKIRTCKTLPKRACLNFHIDICTAPCIKNVTQNEYEKQVEDAKEFLNGNTKKILKRLEKKMTAASIDMKYEVALEKRNQIRAIEHLGEKQKVDLLKRYDQDVLTLIHNKVTEKGIIELFNISKGVITGKREFGFDYEEDLFENFIKLYYSQNYVPNEIIVNKKFWKSKNNLEVIKEYLSKIKGINVNIVHPQRGEKLALVKLLEKNAHLYFEQNDIFIQLKDNLNLPNIPKVIECFDISNLGYDYLVGAMTRWVEGKPDKNNYRRFEIKSFKGKNDDYQAMKEVVYRRYKRLKDSGLELPDLIIIDGGKGQLSAALGSLRELSLKIPIISIAKKKEEIYLPGEQNPRNFGKDTKMMLYLRQMRDSVHNFVLGYNIKKRQMRLRAEGMKRIEEYEN